MKDKISLIYCTCDRYESLWSNFFKLWKKYWAEFDSQVILNTEEKDFSFDGLNIIRPSFSKQNPTWSESLLESLEMVETPYVILTLDDFYIKSPVDVQTLNVCIEQMDKDKDVNLFTFGWQPGKNKPCEFCDLFEQRARFATYRINAQLALWRVSYLKKIIRKYENPWEFELNGSFRSSFTSGKLYSLKKNSPLVFDYDWGFLIVRGQINRNVADYFVKNENISFDDSFDDIDMEKYIALGQNKQGRFIRMVKYLSKMVVSIFRK